MQHSDEFRRCLEALDVAAQRKLWRHVSPHLAQPKNDAEALVTIHHARTQAASIPLKLRAYSHRWLCDHGYPSGLPDDLKPSAERIYPRVVESVGISVNFGSPVLAPVAAEVRGAMEHAVLDAYADKRTEPAFLRTRMQEARETTMRKLVGRLGA
jgi:hypothetical protein